MPDISFSCPTCGQHLDAPPEMAGDAVACPSCQETLRVPERSQRVNTAPVQARPPLPPTLTPPLPQPPEQLQQAKSKYHCPVCRGSVELTETPRVNKMMEWLNARPGLFFLFGLVPLLFVLIVLLLVHAFYGYWCINCGRVPFLKLPFVPKINTLILRFLASIVAAFILMMVIGLLSV